MKGAALLLMSGHHITSRLLKNYLQSLAALKIGSKCFITYKLRFLTYFCLASAVSKTVFNSLLGVFSSKLATMFSSIMKIR